MCITGSVLQKAHTRARHRIYRNYHDYADNFHKTVFKSERSLSRLFVLVRCRTIPFLSVLWALELIGKTRQRNVLGGKFLSCSTRGRNVKKWKKLLVVWYLFGAWPDRFLTMNRRRKKLSFS